MPTRFPPALERDFLAAYDRDAVQQIRVVTFLAAVAYAACGFVDLVVVGIQAPYLAAVIYGFAVPLMLAGSAVTFLRGFWRVSQTFPVAYAVLISGAFDVMLMTFVPGNALLYYKAVAILNTVNYYTCLKLRLRYACAAGLLYGATGLAGALWTGLFPVSELVMLATLLAAANAIGAYVSHRLERGARLEFLARHDLAQEKERSEDLLINVLPKPIAERLKRQESAIADHYEEATVLFADLVNFTALSGKSSPRAVVSLLNAVFSRFDRLAEHYGVEKIKTIGDAYMAVAGLPESRPDHAEVMARMALDMINVLLTFNASHGVELDIRIGLNSGPVVAGVIGRKRFIYDLWGDTVNIASRMESHGEPGLIQVTQSTYDALKDRFVFEGRGTVEIKNKGPMTTWWLKAERPPSQRDGSEKAAS